MAGEVSVLKLLEPQKILGSGNGFEIKTKLLVRRCFYHWSGKEGKRRDTKTAMQLDILFPKNMKQGGNLYITQIWRNCPLCSHWVSHWVGAYCIDTNNKSYKYSLFFNHKY
jgi:hypothetical protein